MDKSIPEVRYDPSIEKDLVVVSIPALAEAFFSAVDRYLIDLFADPKKAKIVEERLRDCVHVLPAKK